MRRRILFVLVFAFVSATLAGPRLRVIYGEDDRRDFYEVQSPIALKAAQVTVALVDKDRLSFDKQGYAHFKGEPYGETLNLCPEERFYEQKMSGFCTGVLIAPDIVLTAGHCIRNRLECTNSAVVFDFRMKNPMQVDFSFAPHQVRRCRKVLKRSVGKDGTDYELIQLSEPVYDRSPAKVSVAAQRVGDRLFMVGHPWGLPAKYVEGGIRQTLNKFYITDLDSSEGNSGSPVFDFQGDLVGILTEGEEDLVEDSRGCLTSKHCMGHECDGEAVFRMEHIDLT